MPTRIFLLFLLTGFSAYAQLIDRSCTRGGSNSNIAYLDKFECEIEAAGENDVFRFRANEGERPWIKIQSRGGSASNVRACFDLTGPRGDLTGSTCPQTYTTPFAASGEYSLRVFANIRTQTVKYTLVLDRTYPASPGAIDLRFGASLPGALNPGIEQDQYTFYGTAGDAVTITANTVVGPGSACLDLYDPRGTNLITATCLRRYSQSLTRTGNYVISITSNNPDLAATYEIQLQCSGPCPPPPPPCDFRVSPVSRVFSSAGGTGRIGVTASRAGCEFTAVSNSSFLNIVAGASGTAPGTVTYQVNGNGNATARNGVITVAGLLFPVTQAGSSPLFLLTPEEVSFNFRQGGDRPGEQVVSLVDSGTATAFTSAVSTEAGGNWLSAAPRAASAAVAVSVNPASLSPGTYRGQVTVNAPSASPPTRSVPVVLTVEPNGTPKLAAEGSGLAFAFATGAGARGGQVRVSNQGGGTLPFRARTATVTGGSWLSLPSDQGQLGSGGTATLSVIASPTGLTAGTYKGSVTVEPVGGGDSLLIPVSMTVSDVQQTVVLSQTGLTFFSVIGGGATPLQTVGVLNGGQGLMDWTARASALEGNWLRINRTSGTSDASSLSVPLVEVSVNPANLVPGEYHGQVEVSSLTAVNRGQVVNVVLQVLPAGSDPPPLVRPTGLIFTGVAGGANPAAQPFSITNLSATPRRVKLSFVADDLGAYRVSPTETVIQAGQTSQFQVTVDGRTLPAAIRRAILTLAFLDEGSAQYVSVLFALIRPPGGPPFSRAAEGCTPSVMLPLFTSLGNRFQVPSAWPIPLEMRIIDDCGDPMTAGSVTVSFSNGDPPVSMQSLKNGIWTGTWQTRDPRTPAVTVTATARDGAAAGTVSINGQLSANPGPPIVDRSGLPSLSSPGALLSVFGTRLADREALAMFPLPTQLNGTSIVLGGRPLPLFYSSSGQLNAQVPYDVSANTVHQLIVRRGSTYAVPVSLTIAAATPVILTNPEVSPSQGRVIHGNGNLASPAEPAAAGESLKMFCYNLGAVSPAVPAGQVTPDDPETPSNVVAPVQVTVGGVAAEITFARLVPGVAALYEVGIKLAEGTPAGDDVPVNIMAGDQTSDAVAIAVR